MRKPTCLTTGLIIATLAGQAYSAADHLAVLKVGDKTYTNVTVTSVSATDIYFDAGKTMGNAKLKDLDPELQKRFHFDPAKADAQARERQSAAAWLAQSAGTNRAPRGEVSFATATTAAVQAEMEGAILKVRELVNRPVTSMVRSPKMAVSTFSPGWFHEGAEKPDFKNVDIRKSQDLNYGKNEYVTSDVNPGVAFYGREVEFNSATKYFYTDRNLPKARLTEEEMLEINRLYRVIGRAEDELARRKSGGRP